MHEAYPNSKQLAQMFLNKTDLKSPRRRRRWWRCLEKMGDTGNAGNTRLLKKDLDEKGWKESGSVVPKPLVSLRSYLV